MKFLKTILTAFVAVTLISPANAAERKFSVFGFDDVRIIGGVNVIINTDKGPSAKAEAESRSVLDRVQLRRSGSQLIVSVKPKSNQNERFSTDAPVTVYLTTDRISSITHSGSGKVTLDGLSDRSATVRVGGFGVLDISNVDSDTLNVAMQGGGQLTISGSARDSRVQLLGSSIFNGSALLVENLDLQHRGPASSHVSVKREATITNRGTGMIQIDGKPDCNVKSDGAAQIVCNPKG